MARPPATSSTDSVHVTAHRHHHDHGADEHAPDHVHLTGDPLDPRYRRVLWFALIVNAAMFAIEVIASWRSGSVSLMADAIDFAGDALAYGLSLLALAMGGPWRSRVAALKGTVMLVWGLFVLAQVALTAWRGAVPDAPTMGIVAAVAFLANSSVAVMLYAFRNGDADMRSVWLCTRNDAIGNLAVLAAALGVFGAGHAWPDLIVAVVMATLAITAGRAVLAQSRRELHAAAPHSETP